MQAYDPFRTQAPLLRERTEKAAAQTRSVLNELLLVQRQEPMGIDVWTNLLS